MKLCFPITVGITLSLAPASHGASLCPTAGNHERWAVKTSADPSAAIDVSIDTLLKLEIPSKAEAGVFRTGKRKGLAHSDVIDDEQRDFPEKLSSAASCVLRIRA
jgi:hypothetical protein